MQDSSNNSENKCVVHDHPVPPEEISRYSTIRDPAAENDIASYINSEASDEDVKHVELIKTEYIMGEEYNIWDVTTDKNRWWVITNMTNLYSQKSFPSLDYTISFHIGLMMRLRSRPEGADGNDPHPFDEVFRRQAQAKERHDQALEAEDYQTVGMQLRECLISLTGALRRRITVPNGVEIPQDSNFKDWSNIIVDVLCPGRKNEKLRQYFKSSSDKTWQLVNWLTHDRDANQTASSISIHACDTMIGGFSEILSRSKTDNTEQCPVCMSRNIRTHFDSDIEPDGNYFVSCGKCDWNNHPSG